MMTHPGERLMEEVLLPANLSIRQAAERLEISADTLADIVRGRLPISGGIAVRLAREFGISRERWLGTPGSMGRRATGLGLRLSCYNNAHPANRS